MGTRVWATFFNDKHQHIEGLEFSEGLFFLKVSNYFIHPHISLDMKSMCSFLRDLVALEKDKRSLNQGPEVHPIGKDSILALKEG